MCSDASAEELAWTAKKFEKQRSVTFASIDLLEPIDEDFPQEDIRKEFITLII